ncbi:MAG: nicotinamide-nucleotide amidohydrolase family protein [Spirochaetes bacterium]|nr:nicotinamide-nucleotide amidohydrolase family protein [Spirochaetota bacterium]
MIRAHEPDSAVFDTAAGELVELLARLGFTLACAESCTGGMVSAAITAVPGASRVFKGGIVAYDNEVKMKILHVPRSTIETSGAVSAETAAAMAEGVRRLLGTDLGISVTGIAGPDGGTVEKPVGTVWFGFAANRVSTFASLFPGNRNRIRETAVRLALEHMTVLLGENPA